jgi:peptide deformylase
VTGFPGPLDGPLRDAVAAVLDTADDGVLPIVQSGHPVLRRPAAPYTGQLGDLLPRLVEVMRRTMHAAPGVGLAAPQVGIGLALAVVEDAGYDADPRERHALPFRVLVNPAYEPVGDRRVPFFEGCLSVDGWHALVARHHRVRLTAQDVDGTPAEEVLTGWPARIVQHETDHLRGEVYLDHAVPRSLTSNANLASLWGGGLDVAAVADALGFEVPGPSLPGS